MVAEMITYTCPTCGAQTRVARREDLPTRPFCCGRCKLIDLYKWFNEEYRISDPLPADVDVPEADEEDA